MDQDANYNMMRLSAPKIYKNFAPHTGDPCPGAQVAMLLQQLEEENGQFWQKRAEILTPAEPTVNSFFPFFSSKTKATIRKRLLQSEQTNIWHSFSYFQAKTKIWERKLQTTTNPSYFRCKALHNNSTGVHTT